MPGKGTRGFSPGPGPTPPCYRCPRQNALIMRMILVPCVTSPDVSTLHVSSDLVQKTTIEKWWLQQHHLPEEETKGQRCPDVAEPRFQPAALYPCPLSPTFPLPAGTMAPTHHGDSQASIWNASFYKNRKVPGECFPVSFVLEVFGPPALTPRALFLCFPSRLQFCSAGCH